MSEDTAPFQAISEMVKVQDELCNLLADDIERLGQEYDRETVGDAIDGLLLDLRNRNAFNTYDIEDSLFNQLMDIKYEHEIQFEVGQIEPEEFARQCVKGNPLLASSKNHHMMVGGREKAWKQLQDLAKSHGMVVFEVFFDLVIHTDVMPDMQKLVEHQRYTREDYLDELMKVLEDRFERTLFN